MSVCVCVCARACVRACVRGGWVCVCMVFAYASVVRALGAGGGSENKD